MRDEKNIKQWQSFNGKLIYNMLCYGSLCEDRLSKISLSKGKDWVEQIITFIMRFTFQEQTNHLFLNLNINLDWFTWDWYFGNHLLSLIWLGALFVLIFFYSNLAHDNNFVPIRCSMQSLNSIEFGVSRSNSDVLSDCL